MSYSSIVASSIPQPLIGGPGVGMPQGQAYTLPPLGPSYSPPQSFSALSQSASMSSMSGMMNNNNAGSGLVGMGGGAGGGGGTSPIGSGNKATTRILQLTEFSKDLKTRDIQAVFSEWEDDRGGFKIKWVDDTSCLIVFADPNTAKRAFLTVLTTMPNHLANTSGPAKLRPYLGTDVTHVLTSVQNRPRSRSNAGAAGMASHSRANSLASPYGGGGGGLPGLRHQTSQGNLAARRQRPPHHGQDGSDDATIPHGTPSRGSTAATDDGSVNGRSSPAVVVGDAAKRVIAAGLGTKVASLSLHAGLAGTSIEELPEVATPRIPQHP